jgi:hypothetical protein
MHVNLLEFADITKNEKVKKKGKVVPVLNSLSTTP